MIIQKTRILNKINRWHNRPIVELLLSFDPETASKIELIKCFLKSEITKSKLSDLNLDPASLIGYLLILLQKEIGIDVDYFEIKPYQDNQVLVLAAYQEVFIIEQLIEFIELIMQKDNHFSTAEKYQLLQNIQKFYENNRLGPSTGHIVQAGIDRNIPFIRLNDESLIQFGHGIKQRRIQAALTDSTSVISDFICQDKMITKKILCTYGIIMPEGIIINDELDAQYAADTLAYPVVIKPLEGNQGKGVTTNIQNEEQLKLAFQIAQQFEHDVLIEKHIEGSDYRLLVVGNKLVAAARRMPPSVIGDGKHNIKELITKINQDPERLDGHNGILSQITIDDIMINHLSNLGYHLESVLDTNQTLTLRNNANLSSGGTAIDVTDDVHSTIAADAVKIAQVLHIDICGIDLVCKNISAPLSNQNGAFIEVNLAPGLRMHTTPSEGASRNIGHEVMNVLYPSDDDGRIPIITITGTNGKTTTSKIIAHILKTYNYHVGLTNTEGVFINDHKIISGDCSGPFSAETVLMHPQVDACIFETARGGILRKGLAFDKANVAVFTNIGCGDHLGLDNLHTTEDIYQVKSTILKTIYDDGVAVFNADDSVLMALTTNFTGKKILFSLDKNNLHIKTQDELKQPIVFFAPEKQAIILKKDEFTHQIPIEHIKIAHQGKVAFQLMNLMASIAAIWGLRDDIHLINPCLDSLTSEKELVPGRFNMFQSKHHHIIVDYGHNLDAINALMASIDHIPAKRKILMTSSPGDRQNHIIKEQMKILANHFDEAIIYQEDNLRSRPDGEIIDIINQGLKDGHRIKKIHNHSNEIDALQYTLNILEEGDLCLLIVDQNEKCQHYIENFIKE